MAFKRTSTLSTIFYYDGHTRSPSRWLLPSPSSNDTLCLYSLHVPPVPLSNSSAPPPATSLVLNVVKTSNDHERNEVETLRRRLFPGCLISIPVNYWTRTTTAAVEDEDPWVPYRPGGGVLDDYLGRERALKSIVFGSLHIRPSFFTAPDFPRLLRLDDPLAGPVSGMIEERIRKLEDSVFPLDSLDTASITF